MLRRGGAREDRARELELNILEGRYAELRMLFYVGKDVFRWMEQCMDHCERSEALDARHLSEQSFAHLLVKQTPHEVTEKLKSWGVVEYARIFSRGIGLYVQFTEPPPREILNEDYLRNYYRFADYAHNCWRDMRKYPVLPEEQFPFSLYASGEYTKMLEEQWRRSGGLE